MSVSHEDGCCCAACQGIPQESTSDDDTPAPPGVTGAAKPVYSRDQVISALLTSDGTQNSGTWASQTVTYSISTGPLSFGESHWESEYNGYVEMGAGMQAAAAEAFEMWDEVIAIDLVEVQDDPSANVTFNYSSATNNRTYAERGYDGASPGNGGTLTLTDTDLWLADGWWTHNQDSDLYAGGYGLLTYLHEIGHALGLNHAGNYNGSAAYATHATHFQDTRGYTTQSYFNADDNGSGTDHFGTLGRSYAATPLLHDIMAVQEIYGADMTTRTSNTIYGFNSNANRDAFDFTKNINPVVAIWDAGGLDKIDVSGWSTDQVVDLTPGAFSSVGYLTQNLAIAYGAQIELATTGSGDDLLIGNATNNVLTAGAGDDTIVAGDGADIIFGGAGADDIDGGDGVDWLRFSTSKAGVDADIWRGDGAFGDANGDTYVGIENVSGSAYGDTLEGDPFTANQIFGEGGDDILIGNGGHDFMKGGTGDDSLFGGTGRDVMRGNQGGDHIDGGSEEDWIQFNDATSRIVLDLGLGTGSVGDAAGDTYVNVENVRGTNFNDVIRGSAGRNQILAEDGADTIYTAGGNDVVWAGGGNDVMYGSSAGETFYGGPGADQIYGGGGNDWARYNEAAAGVKASLLTGTGTGGEASGDVLVDLEYLWGSEYDDTLEGDNGVNIIRGGAGADSIIGRKSNDILQGYEGSDTFVFFVDDGIDRIKDWEAGIDRMRMVSSNAFSDLTIGQFQGHATVAYDQGDVVILEGISTAQVSASWFLFGT